MKAVLLAGAVMLVVVAMYVFAKGPGATSPQRLTLTAGASAKVGGDRATMWFAQPSDVFEGGRVVTAAVVSLTCKGKETSVNVVPGKPSEEVCGVRVRLLSMTEPGAESRVFKGVFEVTWL